jgi:hypothetical protein
MRAMSVLIDAKGGGPRARAMPIAGSSSAARPVSADENQSNFTPEGTLAHQPLVARNVRQEINPSGSLAVSGPSHKSGRKSGVQPAWPDAGWLGAGA